MSRTINRIESQLLHSPARAHAGSHWQKHGSKLIQFHAANYPASLMNGAVLGFVPGRIEIFGRHTDYAGGRSIVCAIEKGFYFLATERSDCTVRMREEATEFDPVEFELLPTLSPRIGQWANYPMTMARRMARNFGDSTRLRGADISFLSTMPVGSGMSGSSALMMMTFSAIASLNNLQADRAFRLNIHDPIDLAVYLACAENGQGFRALAGDSGVGTFGGSEDHAAILTGRPGFVSLFGFCPAALQDEAPWPRSWRMAVAFSGVRAEKTREAREKYNMASLRAQQSVKSYNRAFGTRFATLREIADEGPLRKGTAWLEIVDAGSDARAPALAERVRQFIVEDRRHIPRAMDALRRRDIDEFGRLLTASHRASKRHLWNIVPEIDSLQKYALRLGAPGASGFGAGFGGSAFAVVPANGAARFVTRWRDMYLARYPRFAAEASFFLTSPGPGIQLWDADEPVRMADALFQA